jgi:alkylhydroperoxidase family enzyme
VNVKMRLLIETLSAVLDYALIPFLAAFRASFSLHIPLRELVLTRVSRTIRSSLGRSLHVRRSTGHTYYKSNPVYR